MPKRFENEDVTAFKGVREMTTAVAIASKGHEEAGITDEYVAKAAARLESQGKNPDRTWRCEPQSRK
jgi:hypothetical protein